MSEPIDPQTGIPAPPPWGYQPPPATAPPPAWQQQPQYAPPPAMSGYPAYGYYAPMGPTGPQVPPPKRRGALWISLATIAAVVFVGVAVEVGVNLATGNGSAPAGPPRQLSIPSSFDTYRHLTTQAGQNAEDRMRIEMASLSPTVAKVYDKALIGVYATTTDSTPALVFVAVNGKDSAQARELFAARSPRQNAETFLRGAGVVAMTEHDPGALGGSLQCGFATADVVTCVWMDGSTFGFVVDIGHSTVEPALARTTLDLRNLAEH